MAAGELLSSNNLVTRIGRMPVSELAEHRLILIEDPVLREATLIGRVYCDTNGDGHPGPNEFGVPGVRIYADHGVRVDTDGYGRLHFSRLTPGYGALRSTCGRCRRGLSSRACLDATACTAGVPLTLDYTLSCPKDLTPLKIAANPMRKGSRRRSTRSAAGYCPSRPRRARSGGRSAAQRRWSEIATVVDGDPALICPKDRP